MWFTPLDYRPSCPILETAASGPDSRSTSNPSSSRTGTPSCRALSYLLPGESPTTTNDVFLLTDPLTLPPRSWTAAAAASRLWRGGGGGGAAGGAGKGAGASARPPPAPGA